MRRAIGWLGGVAFVALCVLPLARMAWDSVRGADGFDLTAWSHVLASPVERLQLWHSIALALLATVLAAVLGATHVLLTQATDLPGRGAWAALGVSPLMLPPILAAMGWGDLMPMTGFLGSVFLLGVTHSPLVSVLMARGARNTDGRLYEAALLAGGRARAELMWLRLLLPDLLAGALLVFVFALSEHGVPEFLSVKGKNWFVYAEAVFLKYANRGAAGAQSGGEATAASVPLLVLTCAALVVCLRFRRRGTLATLATDFRPMPVRHLRALRLPGLLFEIVYLGAGTGMPLVAMMCWAAGSKSAAGMSLTTLVASFRRAVAQAGDDLVYTVAASACAAVAIALLALPLARTIARARRGGRFAEALAALPLAIPGILLGIGLVRLWNPSTTPLGQAVGAVYDSFWMLPLAFVARFLPLGVLALANAWRRVPVEMDEAARLANPSSLARATRVHLPPILSSAFGVTVIGFVLSMRELDLAVTNPAGNHSIIRRVSHIVHFGGEDVGGALSIMIVLIAALPPVAWYLATGRRVEVVS